jgi:hypothetical protein
VDPVTWQDVEAAWHDKAVHDAYVADVQKRGAFAEAAQRYRQAAESRPDDPIAAQRLEQVRKLAMAMLLVRAPETPRAPSPWRVIVMLVVFSLVCVGLVYWLVHDATRRKATRPTPRPTPGKALP